MATYVDDNFGVYDIDSEEAVDFYHQVQRESVLKNCVVCGRAVKLRPQYDKCNSCCEKIERGMDVEYCDREDYEPLSSCDEDEFDDGDELEDDEDEDEDCDEDDDYDDEEDDWWDEGDEDEDE